MRQSGKTKLLTATLLAILTTAPVTAQTGLTLFDNADFDANNNTIQNPGNITQFFDQNQCESDEAIKTIYPNGSYACNTISSTTAAEGLPETLAVDNTANQTIDLSGNNLTEINTLNPDGNELTIGSNVTVGDGETSIAELSRLTDLPLQPTIDSFEDGDLSEYNSVPGNADSTFDVQSSTVIDGSQALNLSATGLDDPVTTPGSAGVYSNSSLDSYPQPGQTFEFYTRYEGSFDRVRFEFADNSTSSSSYYDYNIVLNNLGEILIGKRSGTFNSYTKSDSISVSTSSDKWYRVEVDWKSSGQITAKLFDTDTGQNLGEVSITDSEYNDRQIGLRIQTNAGSDRGTAYFDGIEITDQGGLEIDSDVQLQDSRLSDVRSIDGGGDSVNFNDNLNLQGQNISNFFDQNQCADDEAIKTVYPNGSYVCNSISTTTEAEGLPETLETNNTANQSIDFAGNDLDNLSELNPSGGNLLLGSNFTLGGEGAFARVNRITSKPVSPKYDSWDDGDIAEYGGVNSAFQSGVTASQVTSNVQEGSAATQVEVNPASTGPTTGLIYQEGSDGPELGDEFQGYVSTGSSGDTGIAFGIQENAKGGVEIDLSTGEVDIGDGYELELDYDNGNLSLDSLYGTADSPDIATTDVDLVRDNYYRFTVDWRSNGTITAELFNVSSGNKVAEVTGTDTSYSSGAWGVFQEAGTNTDLTATYDGFEILSSEDIDIGSSVDFENNFISDVSSIDGGGDSVNFNDNLNLQDQNISNFFDQNQCADDEAIKTVLPNGSYVCNSISTTTQAEGLSETLAAGNTANQSIDFDGNNVDNLSELNPSGGNLLLGSNLTLSGEGAFARVNRITSKPVSPIYDSWDDGDIEEYRLVEDNGVGSVSASEITSGVQEGSAATEVTFSNEPFSQPYGALVQSGSDGPERGDKFQGYVKATSSVGGPSIVFGGQPDGLGTYELDLDMTNGKLLLDTALGTNNDGSIGSTNVDLVRDNYYRYVVDWKSNGTMNAELYNVSSGNRVAQLQGTDTSYSSGRWGIFLAANSQNPVSAEYDGFEILSSEDVDFDANVDFENNSLSGINEIQGFFNQDKCGPNEAIKTVYPNGSYACNSISTTTEAENLSETLSAGNSAGDNNINLSGNNLTEVDTLNSNGSELRIGGNVTVGDGSSIAEVNRLTDLPLQPTVDSFEDGDMSEYSTDISAASSSSSEIQASVTQDGAQALNLTAKGLTDPVSTAGARSEVSLNGLDQYPERGDVFQFYLHPEITQLGNEGVQVSFARNETGLGQGRGYEFQHDENGFSINKGVGISPSKSDSMSNTFQQDTFYRVRIKWSQNGEISATLFNADTSTKVGTVSITDSDYDTGGVGYSIQSNPGQRASEIFDGFQIIDSGGIEVDSDVQLEDSRLSDVRSIDGGGDAVNVDDNLDMNGNNVTNADTVEADTVDAGRVETEEVASSGRMCIGDRC